MKGYLVAVAAVMLVCGSVQFLANDLKLKKQIYFISSLCIVFSMLAPIVSWLPNAVDTLLPSLSPPTSIAPEEKYQMLSKEGEKEVSLAISDDIQRRLGLNEDDLYVKIDLDEREIDNIHIKKIDVYLVRKEDGYLAKDIKKYLKELFACDVCVYLEGVIYGS